MENNGKRLTTWIETYKRYRDLQSRLLHTKEGEDIIYTHAHTHTHTYIYIYIYIYMYVYIYVCVCVRL